MLHFMNRKWTLGVVSVLLDKNLYMTAEEFAEWYDLNIAQPAFQEAQPQFAVEAPSRSLCKHVHEVTEFCCVLNVYTSSKYPEDLLLTTIMLLNSG